MKRLVIFLFCGTLLGCNAEAPRHKAAGNVLFKQHDLVGAESEYRQAIAVDKKDPYAHALLGNVLFEQSKLEAAQSEYQLALALDGKTRAALQGLAMIALDRRQPDAAAKLYERMLQLEPRDPEASVALGKVLYAKGDLDGAERHLKNALTVAQNDPAALYSLGLVLAKRQQFDEAKAMFDRLEQQTPGKAYAPYGQAVVASLSGHSDAAMKWLDVALGRGVMHLEEVEHDENLAGLRSQPQFAALLMRAKNAPKQ